MMTVGAFLVIAMVGTPGATAYMLCVRFPRLIMMPVAMRTLTSFFGAYIGFVLDGATGGAHRLFANSGPFNRLRVCPKARDFGRSPQGCRCFKGEGCLMNAWLLPFQF